MQRGQKLESSKKGRQQSLLLSVGAQRYRFKVLEYDWYDNELVKEIHEPEPDTGLLDAGEPAWEKTQFVYDDRGRLIREWRAGHDGFSVYNVYDLSYP
jgi:YD repeat-containing protein